MPLLVHRSPPSQIHWPKFPPPYRAVFSLVDSALQRRSSRTQPIVSSRQTLTGHLNVRWFLKSPLTLCASTRPVYPQPFEESVMEPATVRMDKPVYQLVINREWNSVEESPVRNYGEIQPKAKALQWSLLSPWK